jgi:hypothetical protein
MYIKEYGCCPKFKRGDKSTITFKKRGDVPCKPAWCMSCAYKVHASPSWKYKLNYPPFKFWTAIIFLHAHLQVVDYNCVRFHKTPISRLEGVALTRYMHHTFTNGLLQMKGPRVLQEIDLSRNSIFWNPLVPFHSFCSSGSRNIIIIGFVENNKTIQLLIIGFVQNKKKINF